MYIYIDIKMWRMRKFINIFMYNKNESIEVKIKLQYIEEIIDYFLKK